MQVSYSRVSTHEKCPYQFKLRYRDKLETIPTDDPQSALILGHALHTGIEKTVEDAVNEYYSAYPIINDAHVTEAMKLEYLIPKVKVMLPEGQHEVKIETPDFIGYIDLLVPTGYMTKENPYNRYGEDVSVYDIYDFKYSNNIGNYLESAQLHLYKYFFELINPGKRIRNMYFVFIPKSQLRIKYKNKTNPRDETIYEFRKRCMEDLEAKEIAIREIPYDSSKVIEYLIATKHCVEDTEYIKSPSRLCDWCEYQLYCEKGIDYMNLPKNKKRDIETSSKKKIWLYAPPFAGKTTLTDKFPDVLIGTTDGNIKNVTAPYVYIKDEVTVEGRMTKRKFAWEVFKDFISELEKKQNDFKTITLDLVEDTREMCRLYMYDKLGIQHESDSGYGKGWDIIKTEYLSTMRRFFNLDYDNLIICSHEDITKNITKKSGEQVTRIAPNIQEAIATKLAGMVDIVARIIVNDDGSRVISFKTDNVIFGGGRLNVTEKEIPCTYEALMKVYAEAAENASQNAPERAETKAEVNSKSTDESSTERDSDASTSESKRTRRTKSAEVKAEDVAAVDEEGNETPLTDLAPETKGETVTAEVPAEEAPKKRTRKKRE